MTAASGKARVAVVGATGYTGAELVRVLSGHPAVEISLASSKRWAGRPISEVDAGLGDGGLVLEKLDARAVVERAEFAFTALPHGESAELVAGLVDAGLTVVDLGADYRFSDVSAYESAYGRHPVPALCRQAVYGLTEHARERVSAATLVANPGCYPTGALMALLPVADLVGAPVVVDSKSGYTGAGRAAVTEEFLAGIDENTRPYNVGGHRHQPEIASQFEAAGGGQELLFVPQLLPLARGLLSNCYIDVDGAEVGRRLEAAYKDEPFVGLLGEGGMPETAAVRGTNRIEVGWVSHGAGTCLMTAIDNLGKGAAGQAVQNMNLMLGFEETAGLAGLEPF